METSQSTVIGADGSCTETTRGNQTTVIINQERKGNGVGTTGFVFALIGLFTGFIPVLGWIIWLVGAICSIIGLFKQPKGLAIAGTIISFIGLIVLIVIMLGIIGAASFSA